MKSVFEFLIIMFVVWVIACCSFIWDAVSYKNRCELEHCDNIVVLTGGRNRITHAINNIESCKPKNIFISGVYEKTTLKDIFSDKIMTDVYIILGKRAKNTEENAEEINSWVLSNGVKEVLLVTSDYHMRRGVTELKNINKNLKICPCAVESEFNFNFVRNCVKEFHKTLYVYVKVFLQNLREENVSR